MIYSSLQYFHILNLSIYLPLLVSFMLSYIPMLWMTFISAQSTPFLVSYKAGLVIMNSLGFCFCLEISLSLLQIWRITLLGWVFLVGSFYLSVWIKSYSFLAYKVLAEKSAHCLMWVPLYITSCYSLASFKILFMSLTFDS